MAGPTDQRLLVLHALRLKGFAESDVVARTAGVDADTAATKLAALADDGSVVRRDGRISGWSLTAQGRERHAELITGELQGADCRDRVDAAYRAFLQINNDMLGVCTDWQIRADKAPEQVPNDHTDAAYDAAVIGRLGDIDDRVQPVCADLGALLPRFGGYGARLADARRNVEAGESEWFTRPLIDSYHTVWFELHEDLLVTLGIERSAEVSA